MSASSQQIDSFSGQSVRLWPWTTFWLLTLAFQSGWSSLDDDAPWTSDLHWHKSKWSENATLSHTTPSAGIVNSEADFDMAIPTSIRAAVGTTAYLTCRPRSLGNRTVSWIRHRDVHILTSGRLPYTKDGRFTVFHQRHTGEWTLQLRSAQLRDSGLYECQIGTQPTRSFFVDLQVVEPTSSIFGGPDMHVHEGSPVNISCIVQNAVGQPEFFFWYHNGKVVDFFGRDVREKRQYFAESDVTVSSLLIKQAQVGHSGNYTCQPAHCPASSARVHILKGEQPAAMQRSSSTTDSSDAAIWWRILVLAICFPLGYFNVLLLPV